MNINVFDDLLPEGFGSLGDEPSVAKAAETISQLRSLVLYLVALAAIICVILMIRSIVMLNATSDNPTERKKWLKSILVTGLVTMLFGSFGIVLGYFWGFLRM